MIGEAGRSDELTSHTAACATVVAVELPAASGPSLPRADAHGVLMTDHPRDPLERARAAITTLRDAAREGRRVDFRERDPLVMAIHLALDRLETLEAQVAALTVERDQLIARSTVVPPTTAGGNEVIVEHGIYTSRTPFSELREAMSPDAQERAKARTDAMQREIDLQEQVEALTVERTARQQQLEQLQKDNEELLARIGKLG